MKKKLRILVALLILIPLGCTEDSPNPSENPEPNPPLTSDLISSIDFQMNPSGYAPLTAIINLETTENVAVEIEIAGQNGSASTLTKRFEDFGTTFELEVFGLYADSENQLQFDC